MPVLRDEGGNRFVIDLNGIEKRWNLRQDEWWTGVNLSWVREISSLGTDNYDASTFSSGTGCDDFFDGSIGG